MYPFKPVNIRKRGNTYMLDYRLHTGERRRECVGKSFVAAQRIAGQYNDWMLEGKDPKLEIDAKREQEKHQTITLSTLFPIIMKRHVSQLSQSTQVYYEQRFANLQRCPQLVDIPVMRITNKLLYNYMYARIEDDHVTHATVNREAQVVKAMINKAVEWELIPANPLKNFKRLSEPKKRMVIITPDQAAALLDKLTPELADVVEFAIYSGFRKDNILSLTIEQITFHEVTRTADIRLTMKGNKVDRMPVGTNAVEVLRRAIGGRKNGYVFISSKTGTRLHKSIPSFRRAVIELGLTVDGKPFRFHDLRHVFATWLGDAGVSLDDIQILLGHEQRSTTERYRTASISRAARQLHLMPKITRKVG